MKQEGLLIRELGIKSWNRKLIFSVCRRLSEVQSGTYFEGPLLSVFLVRCYRMLLYILTVCSTPAN